jgi:hypothetical protein
MTSSCFRAVIRISKSNTLLVSLSPLYSFFKTSHLAVVSCLFLFLSMVILIFSSLCSMIVRYFVITRITKLELRYRLLNAFRITSSDV